MRTYIIGVALLVIAAISGGAYASSASQDKTPFMVCPSVSLNNDQGMWTIGGHGAYYVIMKTNPSTGEPITANVPMQVANRAQIPAGYGLYKDYPSYPNFAGDAKIMSEGIATWLGGAPGFSEGDMVQVTINNDGTTTVYDVTTSATATVNGYIPLASAVFW